MDYTTIYANAVIKHINQYTSIREHVYRAICVISGEKRYQTENTKDAML